MQTEKIDNKKIGSELELPQGVPPLLSLYFYISGSCNLACKHCWISPDFAETNENGKFVKTDYIKSAIEQAKPLGLSSVKLTGGEPLLHPQFKKIFTIIRKENLFCPIETNGTLVDEEMAKFLSADKKKPFVSISIDGSKASTHEEIRGVKGSFKKSVNAIKHLVENNINPQLICTLNQKNVSELEEVIKIAENLGCESVKFNLIQKIGRGKGYGEKFGLTIKKTLDLYRFVEDIIVPKTKIRVEYDIPFAFYPLKRFLKSPLGKCNVLNIIGMISSGELSLCGIGNTVPELIYGHIKDGNLKKIWCEAPGLISLRKNIPDKFVGICNNCIHNNYCLGSCIANNYHTTGKLNSSHYFCEGMDKMGLFPKTRKKN
jgi:SynChlorMet cassette radical SAM/SPASM protein ScmF